ncbi:hypothetical protein ADICYQ_2929 [Cyclobacterium qasimii M12-11B]|uniref:Uncharacterized protein n=1 Tax=Cyclobacterium qasimii M12-11B TaxID=641524 RepID=S7VE90_9BACT|nr:hypothetical protein ADICYQ_2929 [Cyclobacterium qasimii M12-11B]
MSGFAKALFLNGSYQLSESIGGWFQWCLALLQNLGQAIRLLGILSSLLWVKVS